MAEYFRNLHTFWYDPSKLIVILVFSAAAMLLVVKGWANISLFLLFFICFWQILKQPRTFFINRNSQFWVMVFCMLTPFIAELIAQMGRGQLILSSLDGPSRAILATGVFIYLSKRSPPQLVTALGMGSGLGVLMVFFYLKLFPEFYWGNRAATHFVDPITLPCFTFALLGLFLFGNYPKMSKNAVVGLKLLALVLSTYVALESLSRSSWIAGTGLFLSYILYSLRESRLKQLVSLLILAASVIGIFYFSDDFRDRVQEGYAGLMLFLVDGGGQSSSVGQRMVLILIDFELIKNSPYFGIGDGVMPSFEYLKAIIPSLTEEIYEIKLFAGSHSEVLAQIVRKGVILGGVVIWGLFVYPLYLIVHQYRTKKYLEMGLQKLLGVVVPLIISGLGIQVFNLKMTTSFYMLLLAVVLGGFHMQQCVSQIKSN